jgi:chromosome segregation ATPase
MANEVSRADYSALLDRYESVLSQIREAGGEVADSNDAPKVALPKAEKPSEALKKANEKIAEAQLARDELAKVAADARERANAAEAKVAELLKMLEEQTAPAPTASAAQPNS